MFGRSSEVTPYQVEAFWQGWSNAALVGDGPTAEIFTLLNRSMRRRASEHLGVEPMLLGQCLADSYYEKGYSSDDVLERWRGGVVACLKEEFPVIADEVLSDH